MKHAFGTVVLHRTEDLLSFLTSKIEVAQSCAAEEPSAVRACSECGLRQPFGPSSEELVEMHDWN